MKINHKGFSAVEILVVVVIIGLLGITGWLVYDRQKPKTNNQQTSQNTSKPTTSENKPDVLDGTIQTISFNGAVYSFILPSGWQYKETFSYPGANSGEKIVEISDPNNQYQLEIQTLDYVGSLSEGNTAEASFTGIGGKTYYLVGHRSAATENFETVLISACETRHCLTPINATYELNLNIVRTPSYYSKGVSINAPEVETIKQIVASISIAE